jgi:alpha-1,3-glucan synthase
MPGWYYTVESTSAKHLISQFKEAIQGALESDAATRAKMRAVSAKQRFPVARWVEEINELHKTSIHKSEKHRDRPDPLRLVSRSRVNLSRPPSPTPSELHDVQPMTPASFLSPEPASAPSTARSPNPEFGAWPLPRPITGHQRRFSGVSITSVTKGRKDFALQKVDPFFTDADGEYTDEFKRMLVQLDSKTSETDLCIEQYLVKSEKQWFQDYKSAKLGLSSSRNASKVSLVEQPSALNSSRFLDVPSRPASPYTPSVISSVYSEDEDQHSNAGSRRFVSAFETEDGTANPTQASPIQKFMLRKVFDWPVYTLILAFGQILAANSYQISLLNGEQGQTASMLYTIASIYGATSILWWVAFRRLKSVWVLSTPFAVYGVAFIFAGCAPFASSIPTRGWLQNIASGVYAAAASSGSMFFALNFGDEGKLFSLLIVLTKGILTLNRWSTSPDLGDPGLRGPGRPADLHQRAVVLGLAAQLVRQPRHSCRPGLQHAHQRGVLPSGRAADRTLRGHLPRSARLLPPDARVHPLLLQVHLPPQADHRKSPFTPHPPYSGN